MNAFDAIAQNAPLKKTNKPVVPVTKEIQEAVDTFLRIKASIKAQEHDLAQVEEIIINYVRPQQEKDARNNRFSKSYRIPGTQGSEITYTTSDKFSVPADKATQDRIKELVGEEAFSKMFTKVRTISLKPEVVENSEIINKIITACTSAGIDIAAIFTVVDTLKAADNLDQKQYELPEEKLREFKTLVRQAKPSLK